MTIEELQIILEQITATGAINKARRAAIIRQIMHLQRGEPA